MEAAGQSEGLKVGDVVTDGSGVKHTYLGKDEYGNNMYSTEGVSEIAYMNPRQDMYQQDPKQMNTGTGWYGPGGQANWMFGAAATLLESSTSTYRLYSQGYGFSPWIYSKNYPASSYFRRYSMSKLGGVLGKLSYGAGIVMDAIGAFNYLDNPNSSNAVHPAKAGLNTAMGYIGLKLNPVAGMLYFGVDAFYPGAWPGYANDYDRLQRANEAIIPGFITAPYGALKQ